MSYLQIKPIIFKSKGICISDVISLQCTSSSRAEETEKGKNVKYYHYTLMDRLIKIQATGFLKLTPNKIELYPGERQFVWLTTNPEWDKTAFAMTPPEILDRLGRIRITVDGNYPNHKKFAKNIPLIEGLEASAIEKGVNPNEWAVSNKAIPKRRFKDIEIWTDGKWRSILNEVV